MNHTAPPFLPLRARDAFAAERFQLDTLADRRAAPRPPLARRLLARLRAPRRVPTDGSKPS